MVVSGVQRRCRMTISYKLTSRSLRIRFTILTMASMSRLEFRLRSLMRREILVHRPMFFRRR